MVEEIVGSQIVTLEEARYKFVYSISVNTLQNSCYGINVVSFCVDSGKDVFCDAQVYFFTESHEIAAKTAKVLMENAVSPSSLLAVLQDMGF